MSSEHITEQWRQLPLRHEWRRLLRFWRLKDFPGIYLESAYMSLTNWTRLLPDDSCSPFSFPRHGFR